MNMTDFYIKSYLKKKNLSKINKMKIIQCGEKFIEITDDMVDTVC